MRNLKIPIQARSRHRNSDAVPVVNHCLLTGRDWHPRVLILSKDKPVDEVKNIAHKILA